jgi:hypothetical protein
VRRSDATPAAVDSRIASATRITQPL